MKATIHKLLAGAFLGVLTVFGLTVLSSSSTDSADNTQLWAFLNTTCSSDIAVLLDNTEDMLELRGQERHGIVLDFKSYYRVAELHWSEPPCHLVSTLLVEPPLITKRIPPPIRIPVEGGGGGGVGGGGGGGGGGGSQSPPGVEFDDDDLAEMNKRWQDCADKLKPKKGYVDYEVTDYEWKTKEGYFNGDRGAMANTFHYADPPRVDIFPKALKNNKWGIEFEQMAMITLLQEYVHTIQGAPDPYTEDGFSREVGAYNLSVYWYKNLYPRKRAPFDPWLPGHIKAAKAKQGYRDDMKKIKELRELAKVRDLVPKEEKDLYKLTSGLVQYVPDYRYDQYYDTGALACKDKKKK